jgi:hypothetical protein
MPLRVRDLLGRRSFLIKLAIGSAVAVSAGLGVSKLLQGYPSSTKSYSFSQTISVSVDTSAPDYQKFIQPYLSNFNSLCSWLMQPPSFAAPSKPGYVVDPDYGGLIAYDNACWTCNQSELGPLITLSEINMLIGRYLDYWNSQQGKPTTIEENWRALLFPGAKFVQGNCPAQGSADWTYGFPSLDKHEAFLGNSPGQTVYGNQFNPGYSFLPTRVPIQNDCNPPKYYIETVITSSTDALSANSNAPQDVALYALNEYLLGNESEAKSAYYQLVDDWNGTNFVKYLTNHNCIQHQAVAWGAFVHASRAMKFIWTDNTALTAATQAAAQCWTLQQPSGGIKNGAPLYTGNWEDGTACSTTTRQQTSAIATGPEPAAYVGIAFDPRVPYWFP